MTPVLAPQEELLLRLIAAWGGFGWQRVADRYDAIVPAEGRTELMSPAAALRILVEHGCVENAPVESAPDGEPLLTAQGRAFLAERNGEKARLHSLAGSTVQAAVKLVQAMAPQACEFFEAAEHDADMKRISVALDVAAASIGVDLNPRTPEDERAGSEASHV